MSAILDTIESGTLILAAQTSEEVTICIDSKVVTPRARSWRTESKLIDVGSSGCCAIQGYLGSYSKGLRLTNEIRNAVRGRPVNAIAEMDSFIEIVHSVWERHCVINGGQLPNDRQPGQAILQMYCADLVDGKPLLHIACLVVGQDRKPRRLGMQFNDRYGTLLRVDGAIDTRELQARILGIKVYPYTPQQEIERRVFDMYYRFNFPWALALQSWHEIVWQAHSRGEQIVPLDDRWTQDKALLVARFLFPHFSTNTAEVGPPFEMRKVSARGRRSSFL